MKKSLFILPLMALAITSCNNTEDLLFDGSAAERLEQGRADAISKLTADGGLWAMEYFANEDEPGYVMLCRFDKNGSVEISANHKWIDNQFKQERSLWDIVSDNGTVLSFNSYNSLFHIFSDPADITGPYQPTNPDQDDKPIDETGFGHEGDYEFQIMSESDPNTVRLLGKKRNYNIYLRKLDESTDEQTYLEGLVKKQDIFKTKFKKFILTDKAGREYVMTDFESNIPSLYPRSYFDEAQNKYIEADSVSQTKSANGIFTYSGFRYSTPFTAKHADDSEWEISELHWAEDGTLVNEEEGLRLTAPSPAENFDMVSFTWTIDPESFKGKFATAYSSAYNAVIESLGTKNMLGTIDFTWAANSGEVSHLILSRLGTKRCQDFFNVSKIKGESLTSTYTSSNSTADRYNKEIPELWEFKKLFFNEFNMKNNDPMNPDVIHFSLVSDPDSGFDAVLQ